MGKKQIAKEAGTKRGKNCEKDTNIYIDSDVFVSSEKRDEPQHLESKKFLDIIIKGDKLKQVNFFTCRFTGVELASAMIRRTKQKHRAYSLLYRLDNPWSKKVLPLPPKSNSKITWKDLIQELIETTVKYKTPAGDTLHAKFVVEYNMDYLVTWNKKHFKVLQKKVSGLKVLDPTEMLVKLQETCSD